MNSRHKFLDEHPELAAQWHPSKNGELSLNGIFSFSRKKIWWVCPLGHEWESTVQNRVAGNGCPYCSNQKVLLGFNDLATTNPNLVKEWDSFKNGELTPQMVVAGTDKKVWWRCDKGHIWQATVKARTHGSKCPFCQGRYVWPGFNDLASLFPKIAKQWNYARNGDLSPEMVSPGSRKKVWWLCEKGHEWQVSVSHRSKGSGCPICLGQRLLPGYNDLRSNNPALAAEWNYRRNGTLSPDQISQCSNRKVWWICAKGHEWQATVSSRNSAGNDCPICTNQVILAGVNDLATTNPELASEWNYERNGSLTPQMVSAGSSKKAWWRCRNGHEWDAVISHRRKGVGCPVCANQTIIAGFNDLATTNPDVASEWNYERNGVLTPQMVGAGSTKKVWWKCKNGHEWEATIGNRLGCPICSHKQVLAGYNDLATTNPEIAAEWNYEKNGKLTPQMVTAGSNKSVWWRCKNNHEWKTQVNARLQGAGCAQCSAHLRTSFPEQAIFFYVKQVYPDAINGYKDLFADQKTVMEIDVYIPSIKTAIEYDGMVWHSSKKSLARESKKYKICKENGIRLIRIKEAKVTSSQPSFDVLIPSEYSCNYKYFGKTLSELGKYILLPDDIDVIRDRNAILSTYLSQEGGSKEPLG